MYFRNISIRFFNKGFRSNHVVCLNVLSVLLPGLVKFGLEYFGVLEVHCIMLYPSLKT